MNIGNNDYTKWILVILLVAVSGNTVILQAGGQYIFIISFMIFSWLFFIRRQKINKQYAYTIFALSLISFIHILQFGTVTIPSEVNFILKLSIAALSILLISPLINHYVKAMVFLSAISLFFYIPTQIGIDLSNILNSFNLIKEGQMIHIGIHNFHVPREAWRNSGMFWEPGAFAGYLIISLLFAFSKNVQVNRKEILLLLIALITTFSTTGYIALILLAFAYIITTERISTRKKLIFTPFLLIIFTIFIYTAYNYFDFLGKKIEEQTIAAIEQTDNYETTRLGTLLYDLDSIEAYPLFGASQVISTRGSHIDENLVGGQGNGLSSFAVRYGIIGLGIFLYLSYLSFKKIYQNRKLAISATIVIMIILTGEQFLNYPLIMILLFLGITKNNINLIGKRQYAT